MRSPFSNNISKKMCVLEIAKPVPDKADKLNRESVSKSPENFASGGTKNGRAQRRPVPVTVYPYVSVGISVGISLLFGPLTGFWYRDMNSVGTRHPSRLCGVFCCVLPQSTASTNTPLPWGVLALRHSRRPSPHGFQPDAQPHATNDFSRHPDANQAAWLSKVIGAERK
ncbi:hypothetical protein ACEPUD_33015 [Burkholderia ubonensis]|uniref:hypothetical protein n=1 Tax=Burkholderia ubonensis TaxID=101571 RepID=UPI00358EEDEA